MMQLSYSNIIVPISRAWQQTVCNSSDELCCTFNDLTQKRSGYERMWLYLTVHVSSEDAFSHVYRDKFKLFLITLNQSEFV